MGKNHLPTRMLLHCFTHHLHWILVVLFTLYTHLSSSLNTPFSRDTFGNTARHKEVYCSPCSCILFPSSACVTNTPHISYGHAFLLPLGNLVEGNAFLITVRGDQFLSGFQTPLSSSSLSSNISLMMSSGRVGGLLAILGITKENFQNDFILETDEIIYENAKKQTLRMGAHAR